MTRDTGVPASPSGYSAEPEPSCTVSAVPVSIPNALRETWPVLFDAGPVTSKQRRLAHAAADLIDELYEALDLFVSEYVDLVESGDAGFWDAETEEKVIKARAALTKARGEQA